MTFAESRVSGLTFTGVASLTPTGRNQEVCVALASPSDEPNWASQRNPEWPEAVRHPRRNPVRTFEVPASCADGSSTGPYSGLGVREGIVIWRYETPLGRRASTIRERLADDPSIDLGYGENPRKVSTPPAKET
jgi:hypothetical protein